MLVVPANELPHPYFCVLSSSATMPGTKPVKRATQPEDVKPSKKVKVSHSSHGREGGPPWFWCWGRGMSGSVPGQPWAGGGLVLVLGQGDVGQLGLGEDVLERKKPALVSLPEGALQAVAGGMHTVCLSETGNVYTFGCNDEGALGRETAEEGAEMLPGKVELSERVVQVSAGDSHTAALTEEGAVYAWGSFRDNNGVIGLLEPMKKSMLPVKFHIDEPVVKIASGNDHLVMLTLSGALYSSGCGEQGQLGRVPECFANRGGRKGLERLLVPQSVHLRSRGKEGHVYGFGLSNYHQLGTPSTNTYFAPVKLTSFRNSTTSWVSFSGGQHHTVCLDAEGKVYSLGRAEYGRLGLGRGAEEKSEPTPVPGLDSAQVVACGASVSYAVTKQGCAFAWGMGTNLQLGTGRRRTSGRRCR
ncbi:hypothetical protein COCON_G00019530 [Conger conger]|uniref:RCC1-like domain-containing protein n=1 Tax=Conger conger TaxID=82655 RepID=A0A9Q1E463_CONCO|nr:hypothetical protein COCON_G00019530 [Conger conger]